MRQYHFRTGVNEIDASIPVSSDLFLRSTEKRITAFLAQDILGQYGSPCCLLETGRHDHTVPGDAYPFVAKQEISIPCLVRGGKAKLQVRRLGTIMEDINLRDIGHVPELAIHQSVLKTSSVIVVDTTHQRATCEQNQRSWVSRAPDQSHEMHGRLVESHHWILTGPCGECESLGSPGYTCRLGHTRIEYVHMAMCPFGRS